MSIFRKLFFSLDSHYIILPDPKNRTVSHKSEHRLKFALFSRENVNPKRTKMSPTWCFASDGHGHVLCFWMPWRRAYIQRSVRTWVWKSKSKMAKNGNPHKKRKGKNKRSETGDPSLASPKSPGTCVCVFYSPMYMQVHPHDLLDENSVVVRLTCKPSSEHWSLSQVGQIFPFKSEPKRYTNEPTRCSGFRKAWS